MAWFSIRMAMNPPKARLQPPQPLLLSSSQQRPSASEACRKPLRPTRARDSCLRVISASRPVPPRRAPTPMLGFAARFRADVPPLLAQLLTPFADVLVGLGDGPLHYEPAADHHGDRVDKLHVRGRGHPSDGREIEPCVVDRLDHLLAPPLSEARRHPRRG
eukprot:CAMPEP_0119522870 /NCGR_PEP_ID=MMETSP1344-20130328/38032_1 /TAXON_ID=236787 /ORGANISM="Florenciella parvula, Strain CCMP2471" /LENGTH=160 /DNA_ID=CAMNT_0007560935 /DNA_START=6 /DNA_END=485 /DNA_ORIENTATION=-